MTTTKTDAQTVPEETSGQFLQRLGMDGMLWSIEMHKRFPQAPQDSLLGWCCNMIMAGYDEANRRAAQKLVDGERHESGEREAYHAMHVNFLRHGRSEEGRAMFEKYLRYRAAGATHERADELCTKPYNEALPTNSEEA